MARCEALKPDGGRCRGVAIRGSQWCAAHHPDHQQRRLRGAKAGGKRGGRGRPRTELAELKTRLFELADDVLAGKVDRGRAAVAGQLLNTVIRVVATELKVKEQEELLERLEALEATLDAHERERRLA